MSKTCPAPDEGLVPGDDVGHHRQPVHLFNQMLCDLAAVALVRDGVFVNAATRG